MAPKVSAAQLGVVPEQQDAGIHDRAAVGEGSGAPDVQLAPRHDYFVEKDGLAYAGTHLLVDLWRAKRLDDTVGVEQTLRRAVEACGATLLHVHVHRFGTGGGVSGVAVLAESHISIHTWPERGYAAVDIFMCGTCDPYAAVPVLKQMFAPESVQLAEQKRGLVP